MASVQFSTDTIKSLMTFVEEHQDSIKNENEYIEYCNLLMATFKNPPNNPGENPMSAPVNVPHTQFEHEFISCGRMIDAYQTEFWDIKIFEKIVNRISTNTVTRTRTHQTSILSEDFHTIKKHRYSKTVLLEKARTICEQKGMRFSNGFKYKNKDQIVAWIGLLVDD